jgi:hypothetical protein
MLPLPLQGGQGDIGNDSMWQFGGGWGDDTVWQMLNQFPAATDGSIPDII